jgi:hypothetical protein
MNAAANALPASLVDAIDGIAHLGATTQKLVRDALERLWFDAAVRQPNGEVFILTGDIPAMWIRDSVWQVRPLLRFTNDPEILDFVRGVIAAQAKFLNIDPYANAYNLEPNGNCWHKDFADQSPWVFERKFELDSITSFLQLSLDLAEVSGDSSHLTDEWWSLATRLVDLLWTETKHDPVSYRFTRPGNPSHDYLSHDGYGAPFGECGLIWSAFRPSDDACELPFHVPSNIHAEIQLRRLARFAETVEPALAASSRMLANQLSTALESRAVIGKGSKAVLAYEIDGLGGVKMQDDANYPSLLSLPFLGSQRNELYHQTRDFCLSEANPWHFSGPHGAGIGSPHTGQGMIWPLAIAMAGITAERPADQLAALRLIERTRSSNGFIHESFDVTNPERFTREWFSWAEMTYVELAFSLAEPTR